VLLEQHGPFVLPQHFPDSHCPEKHAMVPGQHCWPELPQIWQVPVEEEQNIPFPIPHGLLPGQHSWS
jgi:hypothetical protein